MKFNKLPYLVALYAMGDLLCLFTLWLIIFFNKLQVICSVLQVLNQIIKDNTEFQENACLVGLVSVVQI